VRLPDVRRYRSFALVDTDLSPGAPTDDAAGVIEGTTTGQRMERSQQEINSPFENFPGALPHRPSGHLK
jgi:hypothetical protein